MYKRQDLCKDLHAEKYKIFFFKQKTAYDISACLVGSEMCIRDRIVGLYPGDYSKEDTTKPEQYEFLVERNKQVFDELFALWGNHPSLAGWYITEEFHDGSYPVGWQQEPALSMLANYLQTVAAYVKSKSPKEVCIAPALWRGMPADLCGKWFGKIFAQTPDIDVLYLHDIGGRCLV